MDSRKVAVVALLLFYLPGGSSLAQGISKQIFPLPGNGYLSLSVPSAWESRLDQPPRSLPPTIVFYTGSGPSFQVLVTPLYRVDAGMTLPSPAQIRGSVVKAANAVKSRAVESEIAIQTLQGGAVAGFYFSATDSAPKPGEYKFMTQGMFRLGDLFPTFTILTNDGMEDIVPRALTMLEDAEHIQNAP